MYVMYIYTHTVYTITCFFLVPLIGGHWATYFLTYVYLCWFGCLECCFSGCGKLDYGFDSMCFKSLASKFQCWHKLKTLEKMPRIHMKFPILQESRRGCLQRRQWMAVSNTQQQKNNVVRMWAWICGCFAGLARIHTCETFFLARNSGDLASQCFVVVNGEMAQSKEGLFGVGMNSNT